MESKAKRKTEKKAQKAVHIAVGTSSANFLTYLQKQLGPSTLGIQNDFIAVDTSNSVLMLEKFGIRTLCVGERKGPLKGGGSGVSPSRAYDALRPSMGVLMKMIGAPDRVVTCNVFAQLGKGGTASGMVVPIAMGMESAGISSVLPQVITPAYNEVGFNQENFAKSVREQFEDLGKKICVIDGNWVYAELKGKGSYWDKQEQMYERIARSVATNFVFSTPGNGLAYLDPNDFSNRVLRGDGFLKFADAPVNLEGHDPQKAVAEAFQAIKDYNMYNIGARPLGCVISFVFGEWLSEHMHELFKQIDTHVREKNGGDNQGCSLTVVLVEI